MLRRTVCFPPAKVNLALRVLGKRQDGFHEIETVFQTVDLRDRLELVLTEDNSIDLSVGNTDIPDDESNLCYRAAQLFAGECGEFQGCQIALTKKIPHGSGLGGGSSDAAATLLALNRLYDNFMSEERLFELAAQLGSDAPFFIRGGTAVGRGRGEILRFFSPGWHFHVLIGCPTYKISTRWAYEELKIGLTNQAVYYIFDSLKVSEARSFDFPKVFTNDFERLIFARHPDLGRLKQRCYQEGAFFAGLSGTGSSVFGLFSKIEQAVLAKANLGNQMPVYLGETLSADSLQG